ncbi:hypothetical protein B0H16DRAFT_1860551 [Mycena metata]|uniref:DUF6532 domain-containing protein n=1 Tax=Mycena metata TaxID=1033252 RepID=A0AAD7IH26_9AGAR|nr:hypothetical protein B0H16DRAFT_1860551 [Mycena metata]
MPPASTLTPAEKRKITMAAKAEKDRQQQAAFVAAAKKSGGRTAKVKANDNAVWTADLSVAAALSVAARKRTLSTAEPSETAKKARGSKAASDSDFKDTPAFVIPPKASVVKTRNRIDFTNLPVRPAAKVTTGKAASRKGKAPTFAKKPVTQAKPSAKSSKPVKIAPARVVAESESDEAQESEEKSDDGESDTAEDIAPNEDEFVNEVPRVVSKKSKAINISDIDMNSDQELNEVPRVVSKKSKAINISDIDIDSDQEFIEIDKPRMRRRQLKEEPASDDSFPDAPARIIIDEDGDVDSDLDVPRAVTFGHSRRSSTSSRSSGWDVRVPDSEPEEVIDNISRPNPKKRQPYDDDADMRMHEAIAKGLTAVDRYSHSRRSSTSSRAPPTFQLSDYPRKPRKVSAARQKQADMERPEVRPGPNMANQLDRIVAAAADAASRPESDWHLSARILFPAPGKDIGLTGQTDELKAVLHGCIDFIKLSLLFDDAYPVVLARGGFARTYLLMAAQHPAAIHIKNRLTNDLSFATRLADIPLDRINTTRADFKDVAYQDLGGYYRFALLAPEDVKNAVNACLQDHKYIFPVDAVTKRLKVELPFQHEAIVNVLRKAVFTGQFKTKNLHRFKSTNEKHPERLELPDAMICLGATAVYAGLTAFCATGKHQKIPFTASAYEDVYRNHMRTLADTRANSPKALHLVLHGLFNLVTLHGVPRSLAYLPMNSIPLRGAVSAPTFFDVNPEKEINLRRKIPSDYPKLWGNLTEFPKEVFPDVWDPAESRKEIEEFLSLLTDIPTLALMITMRGAERPGKVQWTRPFLLPLQPLSQEAAQKMFFDIADDAHSTEEVNNVLALTDNMPLAINLLAHLVDTEGCSKILSRWETKKTALLSDGYDKKSNLEISILLSLASSRITSMPHSQDLLSLLSILPDGLSDVELKQANFPVKDILGCKTALLRTALAYTDDHKRLKVLVPIRQYMQASLPATAEMIHPLSSTSRGSLNWTLPTSRIAVNFVNIQNILQYGLHLGHPDLIDSIYCTCHLNRFSGVAGKGGISLLRFISPMLPQLRDPRLEVYVITEALGSWTSALPPMTESIIRAEKLIDCFDDPEVKCAFYLCLARHNFHYEGDTQMAIKHGQQALSLAQSTENHRLPSYALIQFSVIKWSLGDYATGKVYAQQSQSLARIHGELSIEATGLRYEILSRIPLGDFTQCVSLTERALALLALCGLSESFEAHALMGSLAGVYEAKSEYLKAYDIHNHLLQVDHPWRHALTLLNLAEIEVSMGVEKHEIQRKITMAQKTLKAAGLIRMTTACDYIQANLNLREGDTSDFLFRKCLQAGLGKDSELVGNCLEKLGDVSCWEGSHHDPSWSTILLVDCLKQKQKLGIHKALQFIGDIFLRENEEATAISLFTLALQGFTQMDVHRSRAECMIRLGDISEKNGDLLKALELWEMARPLFERSSQTKRIQDIDERLGRADVRLGRMEAVGEDESLELDEVEVAPVVNCVSPKKEKLSSRPPG